MSWLGLENWQASCVKVTFSFPTSNKSLALVPQKNSDWLIWSWLSKNEVLIKGKGKWIHHFIRSGLVGSGLGRMGPLVGQGLRLFNFYWLRLVGLVKANFLRVQLVEGDFDLDPIVIACSSWQTLTLHQVWNGLNLICIANCKESGPFIHFRGGRTWLVRTICPRNVQCETQMTEDKKCVESQIQQDKW